MGYHTEFYGHFDFDRKVEENHANYLRKFSDIRHIRRKAEMIEPLPDPVREAVQLPVGFEGQFYLSGDDYKGEDIITANEPSKPQPGLWCDWTVSEDGTKLEWNGGEKFYEYIPWLYYLISTFIVPWGYVLNGTVKYHGEHPADYGKIIVKDNKMRVKLLACQNRH